MKRKGDKIYEKRGNRKKGKETKEEKLRQENKRKSSE